MYKKKVKKNNKKRISIALLVAFLLVGSFFAYHTVHKSSDTSVATPMQANVVKTDLSPATSADKQDSDEHKATAVNNTETTPSTTTAMTAVTPVIVDANQYDKIEVRSFIPGLVENGGSCTIKFTRNALSVTKTVSASADATTTRCTNLAVERSEFSQAGTWSVTVSYLSNSAKGSSQPKTFEIK